MIAPSSSAPLVAPGQTEVATLSDEEIGSGIVTGMALGVVKREVCYTWIDLKSL